MPIKHKFALAEAYLRTNWHLDPSSRLATTGMDRKMGTVPLLGQLGPHLTQCGRSRGLLHAKFHFDPSNRLATVHQRHRQTDR